MLLGIHINTDAILSLEQMAAALEQVAAAHVALSARMAALAAGTPACAPVEADDVILTVKEAAELLRVKPKTLYRNARKRYASFARRDGRNLRFSRNGLRRWQARQKVA